MEQRKTERGVPGNVEGQKKRNRESGKKEEWKCI
jgi:hypothetical protein